MQAENLYNGPEVTGCRFSFWIPVSDATNSIVTPNSKQGRRSVCMSLIPKKGTVYVVDDDEAVRDSLQWLLEGKDYRVRCFDSAESFLSRYDPREVACLIVDIRMGGMTGLELQDRLIERKSPAAHRVHHRPWRRAHGGEHHEEGRDGLHPEALQGRRAGGPGRAHAGPRQGRVRRAPERSQPRRPAVQADQREAQVLERIVAGRLNKQIADDLGISIKTVEAHRANIMEKLNANTVADLKI
jgi:FixJ family two-component response regulator